MRFETRNLSPRVLTAANLPVLENIMLRFDSAAHTGVVVLCESPLNEHFHLEYHMFDSEPVVRARSSFLHEDLLLQPGSIARLVHEAADFLHVLLKRVPASIESGLTQFTCD